MALNHGTGKLNFFNSKFGGGKNLQVSFSIFILYTQHKLCKTTILKGLKKWSLVQQ